MGMYLMHTIAIAQDVTMANPQVATKPRVGHVWVFILAKPRCFKLLPYPFEKPPTPSGVVKTVVAGVLFKRNKQTRCSANGKAGLKRIGSITNPTSINHQPSTPSTSKYRCMLLQMQFPCGAGMR
jgi:hypothetical protein